MTRMSLKTTGELRKLMAAVILFAGTVLLIGPMQFLSEFILNFGRVNPTDPGGLLIGFPITVLTFLVAGIMWKGNSLQGGALGLLIGIFILITYRNPILFFSGDSYGAPWLILAASITSIALYFVRTEAN